ncbi:MAG: endopeptidase La [Clostridiales bacterium]|jgi:ATP-dependent Lon protease|nr:endopeptidase La [Clostridiales bacterium]MDR2749635.1 endopeptidase La [Clostridiales bacterium]
METSDKHELDFPEESPSPAEGLASESEGLSELPLACLRGMVVFPGSMVSFDLPKGKSLSALEEAMEKGTSIFMAAQKNTEVDEPSEGDLYHVGTVTQILQAMRLPPGNKVRVIAQGLERGMIESFVQDYPHFKVQAKLMPEGATFIDESASTPSGAILLRVAKERFSEFAELYGKILPEIASEAEECESLGRMADYIGANVPMKTEQRQQLLEESDVEKRLEKAIGIMSCELEILQMQRDLYEKIKVGVDKSQRDFILREQLKAIREELGEEDSSDSDSLRKKIQKAQLTAPAREKLLQEAKRLEKASPASPESAMLRDYIDRVLELPWTNKTPENLSIEAAEKILDRDHYGLEKVKERILEFLAVRKNTGGLDAPILCLVGPPGVGKTSIAKSVAAALNRKYARMSLGGVRDEADIRGHRKTYVGAMPGRIIDAMRQAGTVNPLILLDEIDKMSSDFRGNPSAALLEALDEEQNSGFRDHYLEIPYDLSDVLFICTANALDTVPEALQDRLEIIPLSTYTQDEKLNIAQGFLIPKQYKKHGLKKSQLRIKPEAINRMIACYTREAGVRELERLIAAICRKAVRALLAQEKKSMTVSVENLESFLGKEKKAPSARRETPEIGVCTGMAWTTAGGEILTIEVNRIEGRGSLKLTGNMGKVMQESALAAMSYIRAHGSNLGLTREFFKSNELHIHIPEGATPKDGPSAGITMACALVSALTDVPVRSNLAMTGEITIRGRVLPVGGLKEKILAAKNAGITKILVPSLNRADIDEMPAGVKEGLEIKFVSAMDEVLSLALAREGKPI